MNNLIQFALKEAHNPDSLMDEETRQEWFRLEKKIKLLQEKLDIAVSHLTPEKVDPKELTEALAYFNTAGKYGWSNPTEDMTDQEIIDEYHKCLKHECEDLQDADDQMW